MVRGEREREIKREEEAFLFSVEYFLSIVLALSNFALREGESLAVRVIPFIISIQSINPFPNFAFLSHIQFDSSSHYMFEYLRTSCNT